jgi:hypothetical protein
MKNRIKELLINGLKASEIVPIVGCSPSYISQLSKDPEFIAEIEAGRIAAQAEKKEEDHLDTRYQNLEHKLITSLEEKLPEASFGEVIRAVEIMNRRADAKHAKKNPALTGPSINVNVVSLALPGHAMQQATPVVAMNENKEIIAINGRMLAPMSSDGVKNIFAQIKESAAAQQRQVLEEI